MKAALIFVTICVAATSMPSVAAQLYQWRDAQGRMVYSDQPPPPSVRNVQQRVFRGNVIEANESHAARVAREKFPVTLYTSACGAPCDQARQLLIDRGIPFGSKDPQTSPEVLAELQKLTGRLSVPVLLVGTNKIDGFEAGQWHGALDQAGYPKHTPPSRRPATAPAPAPASTPAQASAPATSAR